MRDNHIAAGYYVRDTGDGDRFRIYVNKRNRSIRRGVLSAIVAAFEPNFPFDRPTRSSITPEVESLRRDICVGRTRITETVAKYYREISARLITIRGCRFVGWVVNKVSRLN